MRNPFDIIETTVARVHAAMRQGTLTCEALVRACLERIEALDKQGVCLNAIIAVNPAAIAVAKELDNAFAQRGLTGPLHGIPVLLKDNCETYDMPTTAGSKSLLGFCTGRDAFLTNRLRDAGAVILAKTNLHEFAVWGETVSSVLGQTRNPYDLSRTPGGSSGGTGAAVAASYGVIGIGTDTINSIRSPSSACALCGIRPTMGLVSGHGVVPYSLTQDMAGPIARTVEDAVRTLDIITGYDAADPATEVCKTHKPASYLSFLNPDGVKGKRLGVLTGFWGSEEVNHPVNEALRGAMDMLETAGAQLVPVTDEIDSDKLVREVSLHLHDLKVDLGAYLSSFGEHAPVRSIDDILAGGGYTPDIEQNLKTANALDTETAEYEQRLIARERLQKQVAEIFLRDRLDALVYPHQQQLVCKIGESQRQRNGVLGSVTGFPAVVVPGGFSAPDEHAPLGVPVGLEFLGRPFDEKTLIEIAYGFEQMGPLRRAPQWADA